MPRPSSSSRVSFLVAILVLALPVGPAFGQAAPPAQAAAPTPANWRQAEKFSRENLRKFIYGTAVTPTWIGKTDRFWYSFRTSAGTSWWLVDCEQRTKKPLFDHARLAAALSESTGRGHEPMQLDLGTLRVDDGLTKLSFTAAGRRFEYELATGKLTDQGPAPQRPDSRPGEPGQGFDREELRRRLDEDVQRLQRDDQREEQRDEQRDGQRDGQREQDQQNDRQQDQQNERQQDQQRDQQQGGGRQGGRRGGRQDGQQLGQGGQQGGQQGDGAASRPASGPARRPESRAFAPDRSAYAVVRGHDLFIVEGERVVPADLTGAESRPASRPAAAIAAGDGRGPAVGLTDDTVARGESRPADASAPRPAPTWRYDETRALQLSRDGAERYSFAPGGGGAGGGGGRGNRTENRTETGTGTGTESRPAPAPGAPSVTWAKNSRAFFVTRRDSRGVAELFLVDSLAQPRPALQTYSYPMPGEEHVSSTELWLYERDHKRFARVPAKWVDEVYQSPEFIGEGSEVRFVRRDRLQRHAEMVAVDVATGAARVLFSETATNASLALQPMRALPKRKQFVWWSERSGFGHFYLHDATTGAQLNAITSGAFRASRVLEVDEDGGVLWFRAKGREPDEDLNYEHTYRVDLDGTDLVCLDPGDANHATTLSPTRRYLVDTFSRVDQAPVAVVRDGRDGKVALELEKTDLSKLTEMGWKPPERFTVKAADGITNLYGNLWKPCDFDPARRYPIIVNVYPGPQQEGVSHTFAPGGTQAQLAQLGFIVVQVGHRGGTPERSRAYGGFGYGNLRDYGLEDKKVALEQLADRHKFIDIERVGIYGHSGGGFMTAAALLKEPYNRFFKVGVASAGNHDNNIYNSNWAERWHGLTEVPLEQRTEGAASRGSGAAQGRGATESRRGQLDGVRTEGGRTEGGRTEGGRGTGSRRGVRRGGEEDAEVEEGHDLDRLDDEMEAWLFAQPSLQETVRQETVRQETGRQETGRQETARQEGAQSRRSPFEIKVPTNAELASGLQGKLLLVHGEIDNNVHPANTMRLVDALIRANKRFDMVIIPGARHAFGHAQAWFQQRMFEYFVEHLLGEKPVGADIVRR